MIVYRCSEHATIAECYREARLLAEALAHLVPGYAALPRNRDAEITFVYSGSGDLDSIQVVSRSMTTTKKRKGSR